MIFCEEGQSILSFLYTFKNIKLFKIYYIDMFVFLRCIYLLVVFPRLVRQP